MASMVGSGTSKARPRRRIRMKIRVFYGLLFLVVLLVFFFPACELPEEPPEPVTIEQRITQFLAALNDDAARESIYTHLHADIHGEANGRIRICGAPRLLSSQTRPSTWRLWSTEACLQMEPSAPEIRPMTESPSTSTCRKTKRTSGTS